MPALQMLSHQLEGYAYKAMTPSGLEPTFSVEIAFAHALKRFGRPAFFRFYSKEKSKI
jgi:hypothetical protein